MTSAPKLLIVTADDFGISRGVNRGIVEAHRDGILTSTSLMVDRPGAGEAAAWARECPALSVGLHLELDPAGAPDVSTQLDRQLGRFTELVGAPPTHIDSHHDVHRDGRVLPHVRAWAHRLGVPLRGSSHVRHLSKFYGQWGGESHLEQISVAGLLRLLDTELGPGVTELTCHAGYVDEGLASSYAVEREAEVRTLCDPRVRAALAERGIRLTGFRDLAPAMSEGAA
jgi:chitin disaccharide deacetylase